MIAKETLSYLMYLPESKGKLKDYIPDICNIIVEALPDSTFGSFFEFFSDFTTVYKEDLIEAVAPMLEKIVERVEKEMKREKKEG